MPNWCNTAYAIEGDAQEVKALYELMKGLEEQEKPTVENGFGTAWLGCLVNALGEDWHETSCRGCWGCLELDNGVLTFRTETAWAPCNEVFDLAREKYPSLRYYYQAEEPGTGCYCTNDSEGVYFPERYLVELLTDKDDWETEYFTNLPCAYKWIEEIAGVPVQSEQDVQALVHKWEGVNPNACIGINGFMTFK